MTRAPLLVVHHRVNCKVCFTLPTATRRSVVWPFHITRFGTPGTIVFNQTNAVNASVYTGSWSGMVQLTIDYTKVPVPAPLALVGPGVTVLGVSRPVRRRGVESQT